MRATLALLASTAAAYAAPPCPIEAPALARLRSEHAAMNAAGLACLATVDATRAERDRCSASAEVAALTCARDLAAAASVLAAPMPEPAPGRPWALVLLGGAMAATGAGVAVAVDAGAVESAGVGMGVAVVAAGIAAAVAWALN